MIEKIALIADSACDLPQKLVKEYGIKILPLKVIYPDGQYSDRIDIEPADVYARMPEEIPTTSQPNLQEIKAMIENARQEGFTHLLALALSSGLSGTYQAMKLAAKDFDDIDIKVFDTKTLSMATGWMVLDTARNILSGLSFEKVLEKLTTLQPKVKAYYVIETLEYLRKGGRIGHVAGMLGELLNLKPIIGVNSEGVYYTHAKVRGRSKSIEKLIDIVVQSVGDRPFNLAVMHGGAQETGEKLLAALRSRLPNIRESIFSDISPALGVHTGPGLLAVCFYEV
ncbi:DegV domain-containing protein [bioreactor metagenome]|uniref:DegV domain-containing protein n=1 Tax=bioreactor metagenome TaxID=1076179 RepID=A0A645FLQ0_9ZZZZ|nr:DegV family protein [Syntrophomonadaceae bacterium]